MRMLLRASAIALATSLIFAASASSQATSTTASSGPAPTKIGYINSQAILAQAPGRAEAEAQFDREVGVYRAQIQRMDDSLKTMMAAFDRDTEIAQRGKTFTQYTAKFGDSWESVSIKFYATPDGAQAIRQANGIKYGEPPRPGSNYIIPNKL